MLGRTLISSAVAIWPAAVIVLAGCRGGASPSSHALSSTPESLIESTLREIRADLTRHKADFPQLSSIHWATIDTRRAEGRFRLDYQKGFIRDDRLRGPTFELHGCTLFVEVRHGAAIPAQEIEKGPMGTRVIIPVRGGTQAVVWFLVRAEPTIEAGGFVGKANQVIEARLRALEIALRG